MPSTPYILLAEDNEDDVLLIQRALQQLHLLNPLEVVRDGKEALDFLSAQGSFAGRNAEELPEVMLLDISMPKLSGMEVLRALRAMEHTRTLPVVMLTTSQHEADMQECYRLGANSYIRKPVSYEEFREVIGEIGAYWLALNTPPHHPRRS